MQRETVESSQIAEVGYDRASSTLEVMFKRSNAVYQYSNVPPEVYFDLVHADSIGKFFNAQVKGKFEFKKLGGDIHESETKAAAAPIPDDSADGKTSS